MKEHIIPIFLGGTLYNRLDCPRGTQVTDINFGKMTILLLPVAERAGQGVKKFFFSFPSS